MKEQMREAFEAWVATTNGNYDYFDCYAQGYQAALSVVPAQDASTALFLFKSDVLNQIDEFKYGCDAAAKIQAMDISKYAAATQQPAQEPNALAEMEARKDAAYLERNQVVAALAKCFPSGIAKTAIDGWSEDWHGCVYIDLPTGQASWHYHDSQAYLFSDLPLYKGKWDGHTTEEKYARIAKLQPAQEPTAEGELTIKDYEDCLADHRRLAREIGVALNGKNAARQPSLCDILGQLQDYNPSLETGLHDRLQPVKQESWISVDERLPEVKPEDYEFVLVSVDSSHTGKTHVFEAAYLTQLQIMTEDGDYTSFTGWHTRTEHPDYDGWYEPIGGNGDERVVTHWMVKPLPPVKEVTE